MAWSKKIIITVHLGLQPPIDTSQYKRLEEDDDEESTWQIYLYYQNVKF